MATLKDLKVGDSVLISYDVCIGWVSYNDYREEKVERITPSGLIVVCGAKFDPNTGREKISGKRRRITTVDDECARTTMHEMDAKIKIDRVLNRCQSLKREDLSYEQAVEIAKIMGWEE